VDDAQGLDQGGSKEEGKIGDWGGQIYQVITEANSFRQGIGMLEVEAAVESRPSASYSL